MNITQNQPQTTDEISLLLNSLIKYGPKISKNRPFIKMATGVAEKWFLENNQHRLKTETNTPLGVIEDQTAFSLAILNSFSRALTEFKLSPATFEEASKILVRDLLVEKKLRTEKSVLFREQFGFNSPSFLTISPSKACNLRCTGCYADSDPEVKTLDWDIVDKIVTEAQDLWGTQFIVVSGGEPLAYRSQGKTILDLAENHKSNYFLMYTNGTLITDEVAERMAKLGNIIPAISLEGWEERTDARRGTGVYKKVLATMDRLHKAGVIFGVSLTATRQNAEEILSDEFIDFIFNKKHALFGWIFQYMPIGRSYTLDLMPTPEQRMWMWKQSWKQVREKRNFLADFWNHGTVVDGCLSAGGHNNGGYMYIEWNGNVTPCVFVPYSPVNVKEIYGHGGNLNDIYSSPFFSQIRNWQKDRQGKNLLLPCLIRDHHVDLRQFISKFEADPIDQNACSALMDKEYADGMDQYAEAYQELADPVWDQVYLHKEPYPTKLNEVVSSIEMDLSNH